MFKKYDPRLVRSYRSYKLSDLCRIYRGKKLHAQTIRGWIKSGKLESFNDGKNILIYGAVFKQFLMDCNFAHKRSLEFDQFRCGKCKTIFEPEGRTITKLTHGKNGCIVAFGICVSCGHEMRRLYKANLKKKIMETFSVQHNEVRSLCNHSCSPRNTHHETVQKKALSESSETAITQKTEEATTSTSNTHITSEQLTLF